MNRTEDSPPLAKDAEEKEENHLDRILESNVCKRLFTWARLPKSDASKEAMDAELREEQRLRWNFDFQTETPLPGRYQWVRTDASNGHHLKNGHAIKNYSGEVESRTSRQRLTTPYYRKTRRGLEESPRNLRSSGSCDTTLNGPRRSERHSQMQLNLN